MALDLQRTIGENFTQAETLCGLGSAYLGRGDADLGLRHLHEAEELATKTGNEKWRTLARQTIDAYQTRTKERS